MTIVPANEQEGILKALGLNPRDPKVQALAFISQKYGLDLLLGEVCIVKERIFVTHSGRLAAAHKSGVLDGIEVGVEEKQDRYIATAKVYRKDMRFPFVFTDFCRKDERVQDPRKRAITRAERNALYRAFPIGEWDNDRDELPINLSPGPPIPRAPRPGALPAGEGPPAPGLEAARDLPVPEPSPAGPSLEPWKSVVVRCREMGLDDDERHRMVGWLTKGRSESVKDLTPRESADAHGALQYLKSTGEKPWRESSPTKSTWSNRALSESPAVTTTASEEPPSGDAA